MKVVCTSKLEIGGASLVHDEAIRIQYLNDRSITDAYRQVAREVCGSEIILLKSERGWWMGALETDIDAHEDKVCRELKDVSNDIKIFANSTIVEFTPEELPAQVKPLLKRLDEVGKLLLRSRFDAAKEAAVFGVSQIDVVVAIVLSKIDPNVDVFFSGDEFDRTYTPADWKHIANAFAYFLPQAPREPGQMYLFEDKLNQLRVEIGVQGRKEIASISSQSPLNMLS